MSSYLTVVRGVVNASHQLPDVPGCHRLHGHRYLISVSTTLTDVSDDIAKLVHEYDRRHLNDMIGPGVPSAQGLAAVLLERLAALGAVRVEVDESEGPIGIAAR